MGSDAMILVFWMLSFKPTFSLSSFTFIKRLFFSPQKDTEPSERDSVTWCICIRCLWEGTKKKKNLPTVATGREGNWELREGSKGSFFTLTSFVPFTQCTMCSHYLYLNIVHNTQRKVLQNARRLHPATCLPSSKEAWWVPAEPGQLWILAPWLCWQGW